MKNARKLKIISLSAVLAFSLIAAVTATVCWFGAPKFHSIPTNSGFEIDHPIEFDTSSKVYGFDEDLGLGVECDEDDKLSLRPYDTYLNRNSHLSKLIEVTVEYKYANRTSKEMVVTIPLVPLSKASSETTKNNCLTEDGKYIASYFTNVCQFRLFPYSNEYGSSTTQTKYYNGQLDLTTDDKKYNNVVNKLTTLGTAYIPYVNANDFESGLSTVSKNKKLTLTLPKFFIEAYSKKIVFYIQFDYSSTLVDKFNANCLPGAKPTVKTLSGEATPLEGDINTIGVNTN